MATILMQHYRKTKSIRALPVSVALQQGLIGEDRTVQTLEGRIKVQDETNYLCEAQTGERWLQKADKLNSTYLAGEPDAAGWVTCVPKPDGKGVLAEAQAAPFMVKASWGDLEGEAGDYLVQHVDDPADRWIVKKSLFEGTYAPAE